VLIEGPEHDLFLDVAHDLRADAHLFLGVSVLERRLKLFLQTGPVAGFFSFDPRIDGQRRSEVAFEGLGQTGHVPLLFRSTSRHVLIHQLCDHILTDALDGLGNIFRTHEISALLIDHAALIIGHIVILQQLFARIEVVLFDAPLCALDLPRQHAALDGFPGFHADARHERLHAGRVAENAHQIIFEGQIKPARARIALPSRSAS
jgi:hypothetical protein